MVKNAGCAVIKMFKDGDVSQLLHCMPSMMPLVQSPAPYTLGVAAHPCNPREVKTGGSEVQGHPYLHQFKATGIHELLSQNNNKRIRRQLSEMLVQQAYWYFLNYF